MVSGKFDLRLISEFDGSDQGLSVLNGLKRFVICEKHCWHSATLIDGRHICCVSEREKKNVAHNRDVLYVDFATDSFIAYDQFVTRNLILNETVNVHLTGLLWLSTIDLHVHL